MPIKNTFERHAKFDKSNDEGKENYLEKAERDHKGDECRQGFAG